MCAMVEYHDFNVFIIRTFQQRFPGKSVITWSSSFTTVAHCLLSKRVKVSSLLVSFSRGSPLELRQIATIPEDQSGWPTGPTE